MTLSEALHFGRQQLQTAGVPDYEYDANALLQHASGKSLAKIMGNPDQPLEDGAEECYRTFLRKRAERIPLQHIIGETCFYGYMFQVRENVLIPRSDTEHLVEHALELAPDRAVRFLDLCTGSGCIGITFLLERRRKGYEDEGVLTDISPDALALAKENAALLKAEVTVTESDLYSGLSGQSFDLILSNPPYISVKDMEELMPEVRLHDPRIALTDEGDGLSFYRRILAEAGDYLTPEGQVALEIGYDQGKAVTELMEQNGFTDVRRFRDYAGLDRVVIGRRIQE